MSRTESLIFFFSVATVVAAAAAADEHTKNADRAFSSLSAFFSPRKAMSGREFVIDAGESERWVLRSSRGSRRVERIKTTDQGLDRNERKLLSLRTRYSFRRPPRALSQCFLRINGPFQALPCHREEERQNRGGQSLLGQRDCVFRSSAEKKDCRTLARSQRLSFSPQNSNFPSLLHATQKKHTLTAPPASRPPTARSTTPPPSSPASAGSRPPPSSPTSSSTCSPARRSPRSSSRRG